METDRGQSGLGQQSDTHVPMHTHKHAHTAYAVIAQIFCMIELIISFVIFIKMSFFKISITERLWIVKDHPFDLI